MALQRDIYTILMSDLQYARQRFKRTGTLTIQATDLERRLAVDAYQIALQRFNAFIREGSVPQNLREMKQ